MTAATTGARFNKLKQLLWADVHEADAEPHIVLRAATTKNRKGRTQHITAELASALARARPRAMTPRVFRRMPSHHTIDKDIRSAGIAKRTDDGIAYFHSLRHTFTTMIARQTGDARLAQRMANHADITTTQRYMHTERQEHAAVMQAFPPLRATRRASGVVQNGPNVPVTVSTSPLENIVQVSGSEGFGLFVSNHDVRCLEMEPGGIEPPCRDSPLGASTRVVGVLISASGRAPTPSHSAQRPVNLLAKAAGCTLPQPARCLMSPAPSGVRRTTHGQY